MLYEPKFRELKNIRDCVIHAWIQCSLLTYPDTRGILHLYCTTTFSISFCQCSMKNQKLWRNRMQPFSLALENVMYKLEKVYKNTFQDKNRKWGAMRRKEKLYHAFFPLYFGPRYLSSFKLRTLWPHLMDLFSCLFSFHLP